MTRAKSTPSRHGNTAKGVSLAHPCTMTAGVVLLWSLFLAAAPLGATSVVALVDRENNRLVLAADCRVNRNSDSVSQCKIIEDRDCVVVIAGLYKEAATGFQLRELVHAACQEKGDLRSKAEAFLRISRKPYEQAVRSLREGQPGDFAQTFANKPTEVVFAGTLNGHVALIVRGLVADVTGRISVERFESTAPSYSRTGFFLGLNGHIRAYVKSHPNWENEDFTKVAYQFVEMEIAAHPNLAGPPVSELEVDKDGRVHWLAQGACALSQAD